MNAAQALQFLDTLRTNYQRLAQEVDIELMPRQRFDQLIEGNAPYEPFMQAAQFGRQGAIVSAWSLWEYYSRALCERLPTSVRRERRDSCVTWVGRSLTANGISFPTEGNQDWFSGANALRNIIAHASGRVADSRARNQLLAARNVFPDLELFTDNYVAIRTEHVSTFHWKIEEFIRQTAEVGELSRR
jgi:hypothetical protein